MSLQYYSSGLQEQDPYVITALFTRSGGRAGPYTGIEGAQQGSAIRLFQTNAAGVTQAEIDSLLGTSGEFLAADLGAAAVGAAGTGAVLIRTDGQVGRVLACHFEIGDLTTVATPEETYCPIETALTNAAETRIVRGAYGNLCIKFDFSGGGAPSDGYLSAQVKCDVYYKAD